MKKYLLIFILIANLFYSVEENTNYLKGLEFYSQKKFLQAIGFLKKAIEEGYDNPLCYFYLANSYLNNEDYDKSIENYIFSLKKSINSEFSSIIYYNIGYVFYLKKDYDKSIQFFNKAYELNKNLVNVYWYKGMAYFKKRDKINTINEWIKYIELDPNGPEVPKLKIALGILTNDNFSFKEIEETQLDQTLNQSNTNSQIENIIDIEGVLKDIELEDKGKVSDESYEDIEK